MTKFEFWKEVLTIEDLRHLSCIAKCETCPAYDDCKCCVDMEEDKCRESFEAWADATVFLHADGNSYDCAAHDNPRTFDWCEDNCPKYYSCDTVAWASDEHKERFDK